MKTDARIAATQIREALSQAFPAHDFHVSCARGKVTVSWAYGPNKDRVLNVVHPWEPGRIGGAASHKTYEMHLPRPSVLLLEHNGRTVHAA